MVLFHRLINKFIIDTVPSQQLRVKLIIRYGRLFFVTRETVSEIFTNVHILPINQFHFKFYCNQLY